MPTYADISSFGDYFSGAEEAAQKAARSQRKAEEEEANRAFYSANEQLGSQERALRADQPLTEEGILASIASQKLPIYQGKEESLAELGRGERDLRDTTKGNINTISRTFNELATMIPRYAGTSAAGAVGEILGRQTARDIGQAKSTEQKGLFDISQEKNRVIKFATEKISAIENEGQNLLRKSKQDFLNRLDEINTLKRVAENDKKSLRLQALYRYQGNINDIASKIQSQKYELNRWAYEKNLALKNEEEARLRSSANSGFDVPGFLSSYLGGQSQPQVQSPQYTPMNAGIQDSGFTSNNAGGWNYGTTSNVANNMGGISFDGTNNPATNLWSTYLSDLE